MIDSTLPTAQRRPSAARYALRRLIAGLVTVTILYIFGVGLVTVAAQWTAVV